MPNTVNGDQCYKPITEFRWFCLFSTEKLRILRPPSVSPSSHSGYSESTSTGRSSSSASNIPPLESDSTSGRSSSAFSSRSEDPDPPLSIHQQQVQKIVLFRLSRQRPIRHNYNSTNPILILLVRPLSIHQQQVKKIVLFRLSRPRQNRQLHVLKNPIIQLDRHPTNVRLLVAGMWNLMLTIRHLVLHVTLSQLPFSNPALCQLVDPAPEPSTPPATTTPTRNSNAEQVLPESTPLDENTNSSTRKRKRLAKKEYAKIEEYKRRKRAKVEKKQNERRKRKYWYTLYF